MINYRNFRLATILSAAVGILPAAVAGAQKPQAAARPCSAPAYRQFDFFAGNWDTYDLADSNKFIAHNRVTPMLGGCALREVYEQNDGERGESFSVYDASRKVWHQSWVTNRGTLLLMDGGLRGNDMVFTGTVTDSTGGKSLIRGTWIPQFHSVRETAVTSTDGGKTWKPLFDILFRPHKART